MDGPEVKNPIALYDMVKDREAEVERLKVENADLIAGYQLTSLERERDVLKAQAVAMRAALERVEWCVASSDDGPSCPLCASACPRHAKDCVVGAALVWTGDSPTDPVK